jgi:putative ribosome biogenesis GTPase RsgA
MKEYKKNMDNRDIVFENRKQTLASNAAPVAAEGAVGAVGDNVEASNENEDGNIVRLDEVKDEIEKTDVWTERNVEK